MIVIIFIICFSSTTYASLNDNWNMLKPKTPLNQTGHIPNYREDFISTAQAWQARETLLNATRFEDSKCLTVGYNLELEDLAFFQSLGSQLVYIESGGIPDLGLMMYYSWCVR